MQSHQRILAAATVAFAALSVGTLTHAGCITADFAPALPSPPADDWADAQRLKLMQELRIPERVVAIKAEDHDPTPKFWAAAGLQAKDHPQLERQITALQKEAEKITLALKDHYARARPNTADSSLTTVVSVPWHASYPSGHATQSMLTALALGAAVPSAAPALKSLAIDVAHGREIAGLHYASDTQAGFELAQQIWDATKADCKPQVLPIYHIAEFEQENLPQIFQP